MKRQTPERCSCFLSLSLFLLSIVAYTRRTHARKRERARAHTITPQTPMMKTKRAFLRNSIRGARTLVFSPPDSSGLPGREQLQAFLCFLGCLRRIIFFCGGICVCERAVTRACVCVCVCGFVAKNTTEDYLFRARILSRSLTSFLSSHFSKTQKRALSKQRLSLYTSKTFRK
jgi:hypothetical protein